MVFLDFDGTVSDRDVVDAVLERYADPHWLDVEREWQAGCIGSRECLRQQLALVRATPAEIEALLDTIQIDPGFVSLVEACAHRRMPLHIVSDGFDFCITRILARVPRRIARLLRETRVCASHLEPDDASNGGWRTAFPFYEHLCSHGCATCKPAAMRALADAAEDADEDVVTIFVGDGLSDRYAAAAADIVFAKHQLARFCRQSGIPYQAYEELSAVADFIDDATRDGRMLRARERARARA